MADSEKSVQDIPVADSIEYSESNRLRAMAAGDRPQERLERLGPGALSDTELLAMLLRSGTRGQDVMTLATRLLAGAGSLAGLLRDGRKLPCRVVARSGVPGPPSQTICP